MVMAEKLKNTAIRTRDLRMAELRDLTANRRRLLQRGYLQQHPRGRRRANLRAPATHQITGLTG